MNLSPCLLCRHFDRAHRAGYRCAAFPVAIPEQVVAGTSFHNRPIAGDGGIRFEVAEDVSPKMAEALKKWMQQTPRESDTLR